MRETRGDRLFYTINYIFLTGIFIIVLYPLIYIVSCSFSNPQAVVAGRVWLLPIQPTLAGYKTIFENSSVITGYANTLFYTASGTLLALIMTILAAYPLSRKDFALGNAIMMIFTFTMYFGGGLIPTYLLVQDLKLSNTRMVMIILGSLSVYNIIVMRTFFKTNIPSELLEAAQVDGCSDYRFLWSIALPLSKAVIAVITLFYAVGYWNSWFNALIYISDRSKYPLQMILREILILNKVDAEMLASGQMTTEDIAIKQNMYELLKFSLIIVASLPVLCVYPFIQRYFVKGIMIGAIKG
ncbi:MAG: carbohydrate ABC transporter permease [Clostridiaceae bacterium]|nr:carbohydrate ABC transporter permease [Clostridiaceae bacterium]